MNKCPYVGSIGQVLVDAWCKDCDKYHPQWKFPCTCLNGKLSVEPLGYKLCDECNGRGYLNEGLKTHEENQM